MSKKRAGIVSLVITSCLLGFFPGFEAQDAEANWLRRLIERARERREARQNVPELDPTAAGQAAVLVLGGAAILLDRRRRKSAP